MYFEYFIFLCRSYLFGIETINTFILMYAPVVYAKPVPNSSVFRPKKVIFHTRLQTRSLNKIPFFSRLALFSLFQALRYLRRLSSFLPFYFRVRAFSIRRTQQSRSLNMNRLGLIRQKLYHHYQIRAQTKKILQMHFEYFIFLFRSYSFGIETINTFILMYLL